MISSVGSLLPLLLLVALSDCSGDRGAVRGTRSNDAPITFAVLGDNRGFPDGTVRPVFAELLDSIAADAPAFVVNTGDLLDGFRGNDERQLRRKWRGYLDAIARLRMPTHHAPGNHDIFDEMSARLWDELIGARQYSIDTAGIRLIVLDTESDSGRIGAAQMQWLGRQLETLDGRTAYVVAHRPLFPVDAHIGTSLDRFPDERDRLHELLIEHRRSIGAVLLGQDPRRGSRHGARLVGRLDPAWRLEASDSLLVVVAIDQSSRADRITLRLGSGGRRHLVAIGRMLPGITEVPFTLAHVPAAAIAAVESIELVIPQSDEAASHAVTVLSVRLLRGGHR